jgi:hypothetical protein
MREHQASNFWKRLLRCRSKQLMISWKIASFSERSRRQRYQKSCSSHLLKRSLLRWQKNSSKRSRNKCAVLDMIAKREKGFVRRMVLAWRRVWFDRSTSVAQLRKKVDLVLKSDVVRTWITANLKNAFVFRNFVLCSKKVMLITQKTAFIEWVTLCKSTKASLLDQQRDQSQELLRIRRSISKSIFDAFAGWTRFIRQHRDMNSKSQLFRDIKLSFWPIKIQRYCLSVWFAATQKRMNQTSFKLAILKRGKKVFMSRKLQESLMIVFQSWKLFHTRRLRARSDSERSRLSLVQRSFDLWVAFTCRECLLSLKSNGLVQRSILMRRYSKVGTAGRIFFRWRKRALKMNRKRRFAAFASRLFKKGIKQTLLSHFLGWSIVRNVEHEAQLVIANLKRKVIKLWRTECKISVHQVRRIFRHSWRAWTSFSNDRCFLQLRSAIGVLLRVLSRRHPSHLSFAIETGILKSKSSFKASAFKPFCTWAAFVQIRRNNSLQLSIFFGKWRVLVRCSTKIRSAVLCASKSFQRYFPEMLRYSVNQFVVSMTLCTTGFAKDVGVSRVLLINGFFESLRLQKQYLSLNTMSKKSKLNQIFEYWRSLSSRNATGKWLSLHSKMRFAVQRLRSWTRRQRICEAANRFLNRVSRSLLCFVIAFWKRTILISKKRDLDISAVYIRFSRTAAQRMLSATVTAWRLLAVKSKSKATPPGLNSNQPALSLTEKKSSARRDAIWKDLNSSIDSESP